jgi:hypothetical protein
MSIEQPRATSFVAAPYQSHDVERLNIERLNDARALHAAATMLMTEGLERDFHFFALHLRVAIVELEDQMGALAPPSPRLTPLSGYPKAQRRKPEIST